MDHYANTLEPVPPFWLDLTAWSLSHRAFQAENVEFINNLAKIRAAYVNLGELPLIVISRGYWDSMPGFSDAENQEAWQIWQEMQSDLASLSSRSKQFIATESEYNIQLQQPQLVIEAITDVIEGTKDFSTLP